ncbi:hypothetical protein Emag_001995 [Eimeria magna]
MSVAAADSLRAAARCLPEVTVCLHAVNPWRLAGLSRRGHQSASESFAAFAKAGRSFQFITRSSSRTSFRSSSSSSKSSSRSSSGELLQGNRIHLWCSLAPTSTPRKVYPLQGLSMRGPLGGAPPFIWLSVRGHSGPLPRAAAHAASLATKQQQQRQRHRQEQQQQQQRQQQLAASGRCDLPLEYPDDYAFNADPSTASKIESSSSSSSSSNSGGVEVIEMLPAWARRLRAPRREVIFLRILPVAPLVLMALGLHALPPAAAAAAFDAAGAAALGFEPLARSCLSALIAYSATLLTAAAAVHAGMQLSELGFPAEVNLEQRLLHEEPLNAIYLCIASAVAMLGVDWLLFKKATTPLWCVCLPRA